MYYRVYYPCENEFTLTTATSIPIDNGYYTLTGVLPYEENKHIK